MFEPRDKELKNSVPNFTKLSEIWLGELAGKKLILDPAFGSRRPKKHRIPEPGSATLSRNMQVWVAEWNQIPSTDPLFCLVRIKDQ
jgi:hypothetical protein